MNHTRMRPAVLLTTLLVAGCGGSGGSNGVDAAGSPSPSGTAVTSTSPEATPTASATASVTATADPKAAAESAVAADYRRYDKAFTRALFARSAHVADLVSFSTALRRAAVRSRIATMHQRGIVYLGTPRIWVGHVTVTGNRATAGICEKDNASWYAYASTGHILGTKLNKWDPFKARLLLRGGRWQVDLVTASTNISCKDAK